MNSVQRLKFYLRYALRSLRRDGTRTFLAVLSVTFGVLSLVAMQLFAYVWLHSAMFDLRLAYGGDAVIQPPGSSQGFTDADFARINTWQEQGLIADYTLLSDGSAAYLRTPDDGHVTLLRGAFGIDVTTYPLAGGLTLREPADASPADVLRNPTDVLITRDLAERRGLGLGDSVVLSGDSVPVQLTVTGIVDATPTQQGDSVFYSLETARLIENREDVINAIPINWGAASDAEQTIIDSPFDVWVAVHRDGEPLPSGSTTSLFNLMLTGSGVLGLLVGGLSVSNTLQVMLARRRLEIAMLKTLGYRQADLILLISLETGLIGLVGGLVGALLGTLLAGKLVEVLGSASSIMMDWQPHPVIVVGGVIVGVLTAVVFGMQAILASSATRPIQLLRDLPLRVPRSTQLTRLALSLLMLVVFGLLVGVVLGSPLEGILYVIGGGMAIVIIRAFFWAVLWIMLRLPLPLAPMLRVARAHLRQKKTQASMIVLALTAGAFSVSFAALIIYNVQTVFMRMRGSDEGYNLMVYTSPGGGADAIREMVTQGADATYITEQVAGTLNGAAITVESRDAADLNNDMRYSGPDDENFVLLPEHEANRYAIGDTLTLKVGGQEQSVTLTGFYTVTSSPLTFQAAPLVVSQQLMQRFVDIPLQTRVFGAFPADSLSEVSRTLGQALPEMLVFSLADLNDAVIVQLQALFTCAISVASLAFVAGAVLIANAAGLNIVERYREIGIFKAVGYTSRHVLRVFLSEYGFLGALGGVFGILGAVLAVVVLNLSLTAGRLVIEPAILAGMLGVSAAIALLSAAAIAWRPTRVRPLDVLRYE